MLRKLLVSLLALALVLGLTVYAAFQFSPWPAVWLIRKSFAEGGEAAAASIAALVPAGVTGQVGLSYALDDADARFDLFLPANAAGPLPTVVWIHGGGFVAGSRSELSNYLKVLVAAGFAAVAIDYTLAPGAKFPAPVRQANAALAHIFANAGRYGIDPQRIFLAGDSAGAQIAAQAALTIAEPDYARGIGVEAGMPRSALRGVVLFCGPYDPGSLDFDSAYGGFMRTVIWSYLGTRDPADPKVREMAIVPHVSANYPPAFVSVGNADPLAPQSLALADALRAKGVEVDALFFPDDHQPPLGHEYQLLLATDAGKLSFERMVTFLRAHDD